MINTYFTIGELAAFSKLSKQTLIYYDKEEIFKPSFVDPHNGYRYYSADQIEVLDSLLILKEIGLSLCEIKDFMRKRTPENALTLLKKQQSDIQQNLLELKLISKRIERKIMTLEYFYSRNENQISYQYLDSQWLAIEPVCSPFAQLEVDLSLKQLLTKAAKYHYPHFYQIGDMISEENFTSSNYNCFSHAFLPLATASSAASLHQKPQGQFACSYHTGPYSLLGESYSKLKTDIQKHGLRPIGYAYEFCILDSLTSRNEAEYTTEIQIQVV